MFIEVILGSFFGAIVASAIMDYREHRNRFELRIPPRSGYDNIVFGAYTELSAPLEFPSFPHQFRVPETGTYEFSINGHPYQIRQLTVDDLIETQLDPSTPIIRPSENSENI